ncbi:MAG: hypothetical protein JWN07_1489 [Hyphomicrobiales bacterium]|nr:hypothetical protein [Hyphomicrobiales bacterium]
MGPEGSIGRASRALKRVLRPTRKPPQGFHWQVGNSRDDGDSYARLAAHLDADVLTDDPQIAADADWRLGLRTGVIRLADGRWLLAPGDAGIEAMLAHVSPEQAGARLAIATPGHFERAVLARFGREIAAEAADALPRAHVEFCARGGAATAIKWLALGLLALLPFELAFGLQVWAVVFLAVALTMCVAVLVRILATFVALAPERIDPDLPDADLPGYTVLIALYQEAEIAPRLVAAMTALDYPQDKLEVIYLIEADDAATMAALAAQPLPRHHRVVVAPDGAPRTKPRALNVGLLVARGERLVIYDAEDRPDPDQLRKAAARFSASSPKLAVLQAQLRIENKSDSWLTRLFALDYAAQFEILMPGMARLGLPLPLGGTSNHFKTDVLRDVGGWDAWNVTEDADLGLRLARLGYLCETLRSFTFEEAPPTLRDWYPQRRRWLKGWMQTFVTHTRSPLKLAADLGAARAIHTLSLIAANTLGPAIGLWITLYVLHESVVGDLLQAEGDGWRLVVWLWAALAGFGVVSMILPTLLAIVRANLWTCAPFLLVRPLHWLCVSAAAFHALCELWVRPHHWSKTRHGLAHATAPAQSALVIEVASMPKSSSSAS